jgi:hypothetical protein
VRAEGLAALPALETLELTEQNVETVLDEARAPAHTHTHTRTTHVHTRTR